MAFELSHIIAALGGQLHGDASLSIAGLASLESAGPGQITFLSQARLLRKLQSSQAACVIVAPAFEVAARARGACIVTDQPYLYYARLSQWWKRQHAGPALPQVHPSAVVDAMAEVDASAIIGPLCVVERGARIGAGTWLKARVHIGENCRIGARCILHPGVVIGADGFGFAPDRDGHWEKIEQLGAVRIGDDVEIGANSCVDRGAIDDTVIEDGVKIDNLVQIAHNVHIGRHTVMAGNVGVAGSTRIGAYCQIAGAANIIGHLSIADHVVISVASVVTRSIHKPGQYSGIFPLDEHANWEKNAVSLRHLNQLRERVKALEKSLATLPSAADHS